MLVAAFAALVLQQAPPGGVVWGESPPPAPVAESQADRNETTLPAWALADPFAWERSQCSPLVRRDASLETCQVRVRAELSANLGDALPAALRPTGLEGDCVPAETGSDGAYAVTCAPQRRERAVSPGIQERVCATQPQRQTNGAVTWVETCRPASGPEPEQGLKFRLFGDKD